MNKTDPGRMFNKSTSKKWSFMGGGCLGLRSLRHQCWLDLGSLQDERPRRFPGMELFSHSTELHPDPTNNWVE